MPTFIAILIMVVGVINVCRLLPGPRKQEFAAAPEPARIRCLLAREGAPAGPASRLRGNE